MRKFVADNGESIIALNDIQAEAMRKGGLTEVSILEVIEEPKVEVKEVAPSRKKK